MTLRTPAFAPLLLVPLLLAAACAQTPPPAADAAAPPPPAAHASPAAGAAMVSAADPRAAEAGVEMLRMGGSATDAAIATMLALNVVEPQNSGLGGGGFWLRSDRIGRISTIDGRESAPAAARPDWFYGPDGKLLPREVIGIGGKSAGVPGAVAMMAKAHAEHGKLPWATLFGPAIRLARDGFAVSARMHNGLNLYGRHVTGWAKRTYFTPAGDAVAESTMLKEPELADTFERLAKGGAGVFYKGANAQAIAAALDTAEVNPSKMTVADVEGYKALDRAAVCGDYRGYKVCGMGPPSSGGITVLMILKQLERFDLHALGSTSPVAWHLIADSERLAYADRNMYIGDPGYVSVPVRGLLDPTYIASRSALISPDHMLTAIEPGHPAGAPKRVKVAFKDDPGTTDLAVADAQGNVVSVTTTVNGYFGSGLAVGGYMLNNELPDFDFVPSPDGYLAANAVEGGKRPRSSMAPTIVYGPDGKVRLVIGAAGGATIICQVAKAIIGVIDWNMTAQQAIATGLIFAPGSKVAIVEQGSDLVPLIPALQAMGETVKVAPLGLKANAVEWVGGKWVGAADPRSEGVAMDTAGNVTRIVRRANDLNGAHD
ncbi:MAG: gamma-glutamyltransferase [Sphingomonadales bacterium]|nr:gamma-glutamyltransferase [Sphingomonadales bacterium]MDE2567830.1 gamma-glutamyltransferase [Sphingomonadales bacterium]